MHPALYCALRSLVIYKVSLLKDKFTFSSFRQSFSVYITISTASESLTSYQLGREEGWTETFEDVVETMEKMATATLLISY